jgi:hypothetical protein
MLCPSMCVDLFIIYQMVVYRGLVTAMIFTEGNQEMQLHKVGDVTAYQPSYT